MAVLSSQALMSSSQKSKTRFTNIHLRIEYESTRGGQELLY